MSIFTNLPFCNFNKYREKRDIKILLIQNGILSLNPSKYNINSTMSMFNGTGKYPLSIFKSNISKSINRFNNLTRNRLKFVFH